MTSRTVTARKDGGLAVVISGPSGVGKTTIWRTLAERYGYELSISATTRAPRAGEKGGVDYRFVTREQFQEAVRRGEFLEHSEHFGNLYGTPKEPVEAALRNGRVILLQIDVNGARQIMRRLSGTQRYCIFLQAPDLSEQERRLRGRHSDSEASMRARLQRAEMEMAERLSYDASVVNDDVERAVKEIHHLIQKAEVRKENGCRTT